MISFFLAIILSAFATNATAADTQPIVWWLWPICLLLVSFVIGIAAVVSGVGGGVLFVPIVSAFFPFHLDFVRGAGLMLALSGALSAAPTLMRAGFSSLKLAMPFALIGSITSFAGAFLGLALPTAVMQTSLGLATMLIGLLIWSAGETRAGVTPISDRLASSLQLHGIYYDPSVRSFVPWRVHRTTEGLLAFAGIGALAGMFGLGAGWANVPALNLLMGAPLKLSVGTSGLILSIVDTSAAWIYIHRGAVLPIIVAPAIIGAMLGAKIGARLLRGASSSVVRRAVIVLMLVAGCRSLFRGIEAWT